MSTPDSPSKTKSGITTDTEGNRHIPSSVRADGSVRKQIKIRPGYRPPEDVEVYKNRTAEAFRAKPAAGIVGAETVDSGSTAPNPSANKNAKRREARKRAAANKDDTQEEVKKTAADSEVVEKNEEQEKEKKARGLAKKLRQARELKDKKEKGADLLPEQFEKVIRISELIRQLEVLGFDEEGERKEDGDS